MTEDSNHGPAKSQPDMPAWKQIVARYQKPCTARATWQMVNTFVPYIGLWCVMYFTHTISWWLTVPLAILAGAILVRAFIIFMIAGTVHFSVRRRPITFSVRLPGFLLLRRIFTGVGSMRFIIPVQAILIVVARVMCGLSRFRNTWSHPVGNALRTRLARNPVVLFVIAPLYLFLIQQRVPSLKAPARERYSVYLTNLAIGSIAAGLIAIFGLKAFLVIQLTVLITAAAAGVWLFYVQHQFEGVYWERSENWDYAEAALKGSSFYKLPKVLQWFSGNIGFHHIHHLSPRIPNYNLERCHRAEPLFQTVKPVTLFPSLKSLTFRLWDEQRRRLVGFGALRQRLHNPK